jgi:hypothetical protein
MTTLNLTLPNYLQQFVEEQVAEQGLASPEEFFEKLVQAEQQRKIDEYHWNLIEEALEKNECHPKTSDFWDLINLKIEQIGQ